MLRASVEREREEGLAQSWRSVTVLLDAFRLPKLTPEACAAIGQQLAAAGLATLPPLVECDRQSKVRLLLPGEDPDAAQDLIAEDFLRVTSWHPKRAPNRVDLEHLLQRPLGDVAWIDLHPSAEVGAAYALLGPYVPGLTEEALRDLLQVDDLPVATTHGTVRKVSTVAVHAIEAERGADVASPSKAGQLVFQAVELLIGDDWLLTCWHEPRGTRARTAPAPLELERRRAVAGVVECWQRQSQSTAGVLGLLLFRELGRTWVPARRALYA